MVKWLKYWRVSQQRKKNFERIAKEIEASGKAAPPTMKEVQDFVEDMKWRTKCDIGKSHYVSPIPKNKTANIVYDDIQLDRG